MNKVKSWFKKQYDAGTMSYLRAAEWLKTQYKEGYISYYGLATVAPILVFWLVEELHSRFSESAYTYYLVPYVCGLIVSAALYKLARRVQRKKKELKKETEIVITVIAPEDHNIDLTHLEREVNAAINREVKRQRGEWNAL
jgi:hypothetical protein